MLFNSIDFAVFLPLIFAIYWLLCNKNLRLQNFFILVASYVFYGWWDVRFLALIVFSTLVDFYVGSVLERNQDKTKKKLLLWLSIFINIGFLGFFKYYNFFAENFVSAFSFFGAKISMGTLNIVLPVGISFYTFQTLSYTIDVYKNKIKPTRDLIAFAAYVSFFPQLVAGPIERAVHLLPQFKKRRCFVYNDAVDGLRQILWGLFKKVVIADNCAEYVNLVFKSPGDYSGSSLLIGAIFFAFQIYGDFSGYSDIAIGTSRLFGFNLMRNFAYPYFSRDVAEFWRRWHISLSTWFRDYVYIPLGGSKGSVGIKIRNTVIVFVLSGFWHGANWTFILWGILNAFYFIPLLLFNKNRKNLNTVAQGHLFPGVKTFFSIIGTFFLTSLTWVFFRAATLSDAFAYIGRIFSDSFFGHPEIMDMYGAISTALLIVFFVLIEWLGRSQAFAIASIGLQWKRPLRYAFYYMLIIAILWLGGREQEFIYFQF